MSSQDRSGRNAPLRTSTSTSTSARERRENRCFDDLVNALGSALLLAHAAFLESLKPAPDGNTRTITWVHELRAAASSAMADAADLDEELLDCAADGAYGLCRGGFTSQIVAIAEDVEGRRALRAIVAERFEGVAKEALAEAHRNARAALEAEAADKDEAARRLEETWGDRDDVLEVACVDPAGRVWGLWRNASPPLHVEHLNRNEGDPRVRIDLEKHGIRAFEVVEGSLSLDERIALKQRLTFREELEDAWLHEMVCRKLVTVSCEAGLIHIHAYEGTPYTYDVCWTVAELLPEGQWTEALVKDASVQLMENPPALCLLTDAVERGAVHDFRLAGLLFADVPPAWVIGWRGHEERTRRHRRDEACVLARRMARVLAEEHLIAVHFKAWEHEHENETLVANTSRTGCDAHLALASLRGADRSPAFVAAMVDWVAAEVADDDAIFRRARRRFRAAALLRDDPKAAGTVVLSPELSEALYYACVEIFFDADEDSSLGFRLSPFTLDALTWELPERGSATLYVSVGEFDALYADPDCPWDEPPRVIVALPRSWKDPLFAEAVVTIAHEPDVSGALPEPLRARVIALVRKHREALRDHWFGRTSTAELADALAPSLRPSPKETP